MEIAKLVLSIIDVIASVFLIAVVLLQSGKSAGLSGAIAGGAETFFGKKKAASYEGKMELLTKITGTVFMVLAVVLVILQRFA